MYRGNVNDNKTQVRLDEIMTVKAEETKCSFETGQV